MKKAIALILTLFVAGALMIYSASRTVNLLQMTLPEGQKDMAYLALLAFDGALIAWTLVFMFGAEGGFQRAIAGIMIVVSLTGVIVGFGADQLLNATTGGLFDKTLLGNNFGMTATLITVGIIAANIAATVFFHVMSPENRRRMQEEGFKEQVESAAEAKSNEQIPHLAAALAISMTESRMARLNALYQNRIAAEYSTLGLPAAKQTINQPAATTHPAPSAMDSIKQRLDAALHPEPQPAAQPMATMASDAPAPAQSGNGHGPKVQAP